MGACASAALYAISVLVRLEKSWKAAIQRLPSSIMLRKRFCPPTLVQRSTGSWKMATSDRSARRSRNVLFPEAMLPSTAIIKGREVLDKIVEFFDIEMLEVLVDEEMAVRTQDHKSERSMMIAVTPTGGPGSSQPSPRPPTPPASQCQR